MNTGDVLVKPAGTATLANADGQQVFSADVVMGSVYAHMETVLVIPLDDALAGEEYEVTIELADEATKTKATVEPQSILFSGEIPEEAPVQVVNVTIEPMPDADQPVYASVNLRITNTGDVSNTVNVVLHVYRDGELVEDFMLGSSMVIAPGETPIKQRYIPAEGFTSGEWTFAISVETVAPQTKTTTVVLDVPLEETLTIP